MATRREVERRRNALIQDLREAVRSGSLQPGETLPPMKELAKKYNISVNVTHRAMQTLVEEGLLCTVSRVGTFVRRRPVPLEGFYLWIVQEDMPLAAQHGFEMRMAQLGATTLALRPGQIRELFHQGQLPSILGVFGDISSPENREIFSYFDQEALPNVTFASSSSGSLGDVVAFDEFEGGRMAANHLIRLGHRQIAFLGAHTSAKLHPGFEWSMLREEGWREALESSGLSPQGLAFHPSKVPTWTGEAMFRIGVELGEALLRRMGEITAIVAANDRIALGVISVLRNSGLPTVRWPAMVGFDNTTIGGAHFLTTLYLPWEQLGREAADLLWERQHGQVKRAPLVRRVPMYLLPRLTSQYGWAARGVFEVIEPQNILQPARAG